MNWIDYRSARPYNYSRSEIAPFPEKAVLTLTGEESQLLTEMALSIPVNPYNTKELELFIRHAADIARAFSSSSSAFIRQELEHGFGAVLVKGLPVDEDLPQTPSTGGSLPVSYKKTFVSEAMLIALGVLTGAEPFNFRQEGRGKAPLIDNIVPIQALKSQKGAGGYDNNFPFHCESAWHRKRPDYLILLGVREAPGAYTLVFSVEMFDGTSWLENAGEIKDWFRLKAPDLYVQMESAGIPMGTAKYSFTPPLEKEGDTIRLNINFNGTDCISESAVQWLSALEDFVESKTVGTIITSGDALILHNYNTCHTRTGYQPSFNGDDRWFLRGYFKKNLWEKCKENLENNITDDTVIHDLVNAGWMTPEGSLTMEFSKYVFEPDETRKLDDHLNELAAFAFNYTPISGTRIV